MLYSHSSESCIPLSMHESTNPYVVVPIGVLGRKMMSGCSTTAPIGKKEVTLKERK